MNQFLQGAVFISCIVAALFFLRFWKETHDRLFIIFALAFVVLAINWLGLALTKEDEVKAWFYLLRLLGFGLILVAVIDKNRPRGIKH